MNTFDILINKILFENNNKPATQQDPQEFIDIQDLERQSRPQEELDKEEILNNITDPEYMKRISQDVQSGTGIYKNKTGGEILHKGYKNLSDLSNNPFWSTLWAAIQIIDVTQITSIPDVVSAQKDYIDNPTTANAFWVCFHSFFLALGLVSLVSTGGGGVMTDALGISLKYSLKSHPEKVYELIKDYILPNKNRILQAINKVNLPIATTNTALNQLEKNIIINK